MMMAAINQQVDEPAMIRGEMRHNEPMSKHTSWRVGGPADQFYVPADRDDLISCDVGGIRQQSASARRWYPWRDHRHP